MTYSHIFVVAFSNFFLILPLGQFLCLKLFLEVEDNLGAGCWLLVLLAAGSALKYL